MQGFEQRRCETSRRAETCPGRNVSHARNLQVTFLHAGQLQCFSDAGVLYLIDRACFLELRTLKSETLHDAPMDGHVNIRVDRRCNQESSVLAVIRRQISPAAAERDSQWRARDDHSGNANMKKQTGLSSTRSAGSAS